MTTWREKPLICHTIGISWVLGLSDAARLRLVSGCISGRIGHYTPELGVILIRIYEPLERFDWFHDNFTLASIFNNTATATVEEKRKLLHHKSSQ